LKYNYIYSIKNIIFAKSLKSIDLRFNLINNKYPIYFNFQIPFFGKNLKNLKKFLKKKKFEIEIEKEIYKFKEFEKLTIENKENVEIEKKNFIDKKVNEKISELEREIEKKKKLEKKKLGEKIEGDEEDYDDEDDDEDYSYFRVIFLYYKI
jgi:hypothetical protein